MLCADCQVNRVVASEVIDALTEPDLVKREAAADSHLIDCSKATSHPTSLAWHVIQFEASSTGYKQLYSVSFLGRQTYKSVKILQNATVLHLFFSYL